MSWCWQRRNMRKEAYVREATIKTAIITQFKGEGLTKMRRKLQNQRGNYKLSLSYLAQSLGPSANVIAIFMASKPINANQLILANSKMARRKSVILISLSYLSSTIAIAANVRTRNRHAIILMYTKQTAIFTIYDAILTMKKGIKAKTKLPAIITIKGTHFPKPNKPTKHTEKTVRQTGQESIAAFCESKQSIG